MGIRILVVDDEPDCAALMVRRLRKLGAEAVVAHDPIGALALLDQDVAGDIGGVISDIDMPGMNGVTLAEEIRKRKSRMPIAFCTGSDLDGEVCRRAAVFGPVLPKSVSTEGVGRVLDKFAA